MFCRWDVQTPSMPPCPFFLSPCIGRLGNRWSSFEPITQPDPLIVTNLPESLIWGLPNSALYNVAFVSVLLCLFSLFFSLCVRGREVKRERKWQKEKKREKELSVHICTPVSEDIPPLWNKTSLWVGQYFENTVNNSEASFSATYSSHLSKEQLIVSHCVRVLLISQSHMGRSTCLLHDSVGGLSQLNGIRKLPHQQWHYAAACHRRQ